MNFVTITLESLHARRDELLEVARRRSATAVWLTRGDVAARGGLPDRDQHIAAQAVPL
jgi:hypothetical protein